MFDDCTLISKEYMLLHLIVLLSNNSWIDENCRKSWPEMKLGVNYL